MRKRTHKPEPKTLQSEIKRQRPELDENSISELETKLKEILKNLRLGVIEYFYFSRVHGTVTFLADEYEYEVRLDGSKPPAIRPRQFMASTGQSFVTQTESSTNWSGGTRKVPKFD